jgi:GTP-binding protein
MLEIIKRVRQRREEMIAAGEEVTVLREVDRFSERPARTKKLPPHLAGPTAQLSNERQAKDYKIDPVRPASTEDKP